MEEKKVEATLLRALENLFKDQNHTSYSSCRKMMRVRNPMDKMRTNGK